MLSSWNDAATPCLGRCRGCPVKSKGEILPQRTAGGIAGRQHAVKVCLEALAACFPCQSASARVGGLNWVPALWVPLAFFSRLFCRFRMYYTA